MSYLYIAVAYFAVAFVYYRLVLGLDRFITFTAEFVGALLVLCFWPLMAIWLTYRDLMKALKDD